VWAENLRLVRIVLIIACISFLSAALEPAFCWSNGGYSADPTHPDYGTHDWIAQHALDYLPFQEKQYITTNLAAYLYRTELPDRPASQGGIGDTTKHHVYYSAAGALVDDASAQRAQNEFNLALNYLKNNDSVNAAKVAGTMTHYIADLAAFGHVMGASTPWGTETHHSDYENHVTDKTTGYSSTFNSYLSFDGNLIDVSAYNATVDLAYNTVFGGSNQLSCIWMDDNYNWSNTAFSDRCGESLNLAVNAVADVLHTLYREGSPASTPTAQVSSTPITPEFPTTQAVAAGLLAVLVVAIFYKRNKR
jgi:hypothetical protein